MRVTFIEPAAPGFHVYSFLKLPRLGLLPLLGTLFKERAVMRYASTQRA